MPASFPPDDITVLQAIINTSERLKNRLRHTAHKRSSPRVPRASQPSAAPQLLLPYPHGMIKTVQKAALLLPQRTRIISKIEQWYQDVRRTIQAEYDNALSQLATAPYSTVVQLEADLQSFYESFFRQKTASLSAEIESKLQGAAINLSPAGAANAVKRRTSFNHECLPLLETYFEYNAYPSAQDRALLARKTMLCPRQIEVWFQNHRARAKKEGRQLRRLSQDPLPRHLNLEPLNDPAPACLVPGNAIKPQKRDSHPPAPANITTPLTSVPIPLATEACAASHLYAFPAKRQPDSGQTLVLLSGKSWSFPPPVWPRQASGKASVRTRKDTATVDELAIEIQQKLSLTGAGSPRRPRPFRPCPSAWYPTIAVPLAAPHFALIRQPTIPQSESSSKTYLIPLSIRRLCNKNPTPFSKYERPTPYHKQRPPQHRSLRRRTPSNSSLSSMSSSEELELRTPSPPPSPKRMSLPRGAPMLSQYPDCDAWLLPK